MYHGTSSVFLQSILKQGVIPNPTKKRWDTDVASRSTFSRASLPGSYWSSNYMTASSSAHNTMRKFGGEEIIVIAQIMEQSAYADEDNINSQLKWAVSDTVKEVYPQIRSDFWVSLAEELFGDHPEKRKHLQTIFTQLLHKYLKGSEKHYPDTALCNKLLDLLVLRDMAFEKQNGMRLDMWMTKVPEIPPVSDIEDALLQLRERLTKSYRYSTYYTDDKFNHTLRIPTTVGFRGTNKIKWILKMTKWDVNRTEGEGKLAKIIIDPIILIYGNTVLPEDFLHQYRERIGKFPGLVDSSGHMLMPSEREEREP